MDRVIKNDLNVITYKAITGLDLVINPDLAMQPETALFVLVHGLKNGTFTRGKHKFEDHISGSKVDYFNARR